MTNKIFITALAAASALFFGCDPFDEVSSTPAGEVVKPGEVNITTANVTDYGFSFTVAPASESTYYAYLVQQADKPAELDPTTLYKNGYKDIDGYVASGSVSYAQKASFTSALEKLVPNTTYQIYAVTASKTGVVSGVTSKSVVTSDAESPYLTAINFNADEKTAKVLSVSLVYNEPLTKSATAFEIEIAVYGVGAFNYQEYRQPEYTFKVSSDKITVKGAEVVLDLGTNDIPGNAVAQFAIPEGAFLDATQNKNKPSQLGHDSGKLFPPVIQREKLTFEMPKPNESEIVDINAPVTVNFPEGVVLGQYLDKDPDDGKWYYYWDIAPDSGTLTYYPEYDSPDGPERKTTYTMSWDNIGFGGSFPSFNVLEVYLTELPHYGDTVVINFSKNGFVDQYQNSVADYEAKVVFKDPAFKPAS